MEQCGKTEHVVYVVKKFELRFVCNVFLNKEHMQKISHPGHFKSDIINIFAFTVNQTTAAYDAHYHRRLQLLFKEFCVSWLLVFGFAAQNYAVLVRCLLGLGNKSILN